MKRSLKGFFYKLIKECVTKNKTRIALARKLAIVMFTFLKENKRFENYFNKNFATLKG